MRTSKDITQTYTHLSTASLMSLIQVFLSSLDDVWTSYISGPAAEALIKNIPRSLFATSRTINFCRAMTGGFWSWRTLKVQSNNPLHNKKEECITSVAYTQFMHPYHSGKRELLVFFLQEDERICEKEGQDVCGSADKQENMLKGCNYYKSNRTARKVPVSPLSRPVAVFHRSRPWCLSVCPGPIMSCLRKVWPFFSLAALRFSMRFHTSCNLWCRSYSLTLRSTAVITSRIWTSAFERSACSSVSSEWSQKYGTQVIFSQYVALLTMLMLQPAEGSRWLTLSVL